MAPKKKAPKKKVSKVSPTSPEPRAAAIFDLDRTLLSGASGPIISEALRQVGLIPGTKTMVETMMFRLFDVVGETWPAMLVTRQGARMAKGWDISLVRKAGALAAKPLSDAVLPYAHDLFDEHRAAGRPLVLATTTPRDLVKPLADALGFDDVIATEYGANGGLYDGSIDGLFIWGKGKAEAVKTWAEGNAIDLEQSYAYSDSYYDTPLLSIVGNPFAVNPDPRMIGVAALRRWPIVHLDVPHGVPKLFGVEPQRALMAVAQPQLVPWARFVVRGEDRIPMDGKGIIVANHRSYLDPFAMAYMLARRGRTVRFLGKKEVFDAPVLGELVKAMGAIRVDRGTGSGEPLERAEDALAAGEMVAMMPQGTIPRGPEFFEPVLKGRWGAAKLVAASGAPVIPVGLWGTEKVWPRSSKIPNVTNVLHPPVIRVQVGEPFHPEGDDLDEVTADIMAHIMDQLPAEAGRRHEPSPEELASTYPSGVIPDDIDGASQHEAGRRPGTD